MKSVLVVGGTGFIGSNLIRILIKQGVEVYALIRPDSSLGTKNLKSIIGVKYIKSTIKELQKNKEIPNFDVCYNLAAYGVDYEQQNIENMIDVNIKFLMEVIDFVYINKTRVLINTGSCFEYGINEGEKLSETSKLNPQSLYGASKMAGNIMGNSYAKLKNVNMITVRPFGIYGPGEGVTRLTIQLIRSIINGEKLDMTEGEQVRDYLYIDDLVDAYIKLADSDSLKRYDNYNICSSKPISIRQFVDIFCSVFKCDRDLFKHGRLQYRDNEVMHFVGDNSKIIETIDWEVKTSMENGLKLTLQWYKDNFDEV